MKTNKQIFHRMSELNNVNSAIDLHLHTTWTDGKNSIGEVIKQAEKNGLWKIGITDHIRRSSDYYSDYLKEIEESKKRSNIEIYCGFEAKIMNFSGKLDIPLEAVQKADFIIGSVHRLPSGDEYKRPKEFSYEELARLEKELSLAAIYDNENINVLGHCGGMSLATYGRFPKRYFEEIIEACAKNDVVFEYNYKYHNDNERLIKDILTKYDPYVSVGSDAHEVAKISNRSFIS